MASKITKKNIPPEIEKMTVLVGEFMNYWGFKKIHGMIWSHIFLSQEPLDAHALMERLGVSKALVSISIRDLLDYEVIKEIGKSNKGTLVYEANPNVIDVILNVLKKREKKMLGDLDASFKLLRDMNMEERKRMNLNPKRVKVLGKMIREAQNTLNGMIALSELPMGGWQEIDETEQTL